MLIYVGGSKGGVGKSLVSMLCLHHYISHEMNPVLIDTDDSNPDVYRAYKDYCDCFAYTIDEEEGWRSIITTIIENKERPVIINSCARNMTSLEKYGMIFNSPELGVDLTTLWVINNQRDSLALLVKYLRIVQQKICVVENGFFAKDGQFSFFDESNIKKNGIRSVFVEKSTNALANMLYIQRKPIHEYKNMFIADRLLAEKWIASAPVAIATALDIAAKYEQVESEA